MRHLMLSIGLLSAALPPTAHAADYCVGTVTQLQAALDQTEVDGVDSEIKVRAGTYAVSGDLRYEPISEFLVPAGKLTIRGGYNSDCSSRSDADGATRFTGNGSHRLLATTQTASVAFAGMAFEGVHVAARSRVLGACIANNPRFTVRRLRVTGASVEVTAQCHDVIVENSLFVDAVSHPDVSLSATALELDTVDYDDERIGSITLVNNTVVNGLVNLRACCDGFIGTASVYNSIFSRASGSELIASGLLLTAKNNRYDSLSLIEGAVLTALSANNASSATNLDADFRPAAGSAMLNSGTGTVPGGLSEIDQAGGDRVIGTSIDRGARESLIDGSGIYTVTNNSSSGTGSLAWAIAQANAESGFNRIAFNIPGSGCPKVISVPTALIVNERLAIDGFSQPGAQTNTLEGNLWNGLPCILLRGPNNSPPFSGVGIETGGDLGTGRLSITGLAFERFGLAVSLLFGRDHSIQGSQFGGVIGTSGAPLAGNTQAIALVGGRDTTIGGTFPSHRNLIGSSSSIGIQIAQFLGLGGEGITVINNLIGTDKDGTGSLPNGTGIVINGPNNVVEDNVIAGNTVDGIRIAGSNATGNEIVENNIGGNLDLVTFLQGNGRMGIMVENGASQNTIGPNNRIGRNGDDGIRIFSDAAGRNRVTGNLLARNDAMGIDLGANGVTANDSDPAACPVPQGCAANRGQNFPDLGEAELKTQGLIPQNTPVQIRGTLRSVVGGPYRIELFASDSCEANGHGEARRLLASTVLTIPNEPYCPPGSPLCVQCAAGNCTKDFSVWVPLLFVQVGDVVTATATTPLGDTSEFSACQTVTREVGPDALFKNGFEFEVIGP
jgi:hypothetical protein